MADSNISPNDELAELIAQSLIEEGLISTEYFSDLKAKLKSGGVKEDDWLRWIKPVTKPSRTGGDSGD